MQPTPSVGAFLQLCGISSAMASAMFTSTCRARLMATCWAARSSVLYGPCHTSRWHRSRFCTSPTRKAVPKPYPFYVQCPQVGPLTSRAAPILCSLLSITNSARTRHVRSCSSCVSARSLRATRLCRFSSFVHPCCGTAKACGESDTYCPWRFGVSATLKTCHSLRPTPRCT